MVEYNYKLGEAMWRCNREIKTVNHNLNPNQFTLIVTDTDDRKILLKFNLL